MKRTLKKVKINKPPFFADKKMYCCEGYWDIYRPTKPFDIDQIKKFKKIKEYIPQKFISKDKWDDKNKFIKRVNKIEKELYSIGKIQKFKGLSPSRIEDHVYIGSGEFYDKNICWPQGYVSYYIDKYNVMPTLKFYNYVINYKFKSNIKSIKKSRK